MKNIYALIVIIPLVIPLLGCDAFVKVPLTDTSDTLRVQFECGTLEVSMMVFQGHSFDFRQSFDIHDSITLSPDSLIVEYKNRTYPCYFLEDLEGFSKITFTGNRMVRTAFHIDSNVNRGDTITVFPRSYLKCRGIVVEIQPITLIMTEDLRGPFGS
jgi:hypothetical protein